MGLTHICGGSASAAASISGLIAVMYRTSALSLIISPLILNLSQKLARCGLVIRPTRQAVCRPCAIMHAAEPFPLLPVTTAQGVPALARMIRPALAQIIRLPLVLAVTAMFRSPPLVSC